MPKRRILIVEDEPMVAKHLRASLEKLGFEVCAMAASAEAAIAAAGTKRPELALMDINLEGDKDGIHAAEQLRAQHHIPVVFLSGHSDPGTTARAGQTLPFGYLVKPFTVETLRTTIETAFYRHESEQKLRALERWLATTLTSMADAIISVDANRQITFFNSAAEMLTGYSRRDVLGRPPSEVVRVVDLNDASRPIDPFTDALGGGVTINVTDGKGLVTREGTVVPVNYSAAPIRLDGGDGVVGVVLAMRDGSVARQAEEDRLRVWQKMQDAQRFESLGMLAGAIAHDFNNLFALMLGNTELTRNALPSGHVGHKYLKNVEGAVLSGTELCRQMLASAGHSGYALRPLDVNEQVQVMVQRLRDSMGESPELRLSLGAGLPAIVIDPSQLQEVVANLVVNGREAMTETRPGVVTVSTGVIRRTDRTFIGAVLTPEREDADYVFIEVADNGKGIPANLLPRIWDPFFTTKFTGRGLGLSSVYGIIRSAKGGIVVQSTVGSGTTLRVYIPAEASRR